MRMNFDISEELKQLCHEARCFMTKRYPAAVPRRILLGDARDDQALWREVAEKPGRAMEPVPYAASVCLAPSRAMTRNARRSDHTK